jgi:hypothetical protein
LNDWSTGQFTRAELALKWGISSANILSYALSNARRAGDPRALTLKEKNSVGKVRIAVEAEATRKRTTAEEMGIKIGATVVKLDYSRDVSWKGDTRNNRITMSGGDSRWETVTAYCALAERLEDGRCEFLMAA